jgi:arsenite methyltransferase
MPDKPQTPDEKLQQEFNRWAAEGEGEKMERHHLDITEKTIRLMNLRPGERVLDLGCGSGWATRLLARLVGDGPEGFGQVVGVDVSDEMVRQARIASKDFDNILYVWGSAQQIPWEENFFDKVLSVESFYYYADQDRALMELFRVMAPRGKLFILINLYKDNEYSLQWVDKLKVPVHVRSAAEYVELLKKHAFENVEARRIPDDTPTPDDYKTKSFDSLDDLRAFKRESGAEARQEKGSIAAFKRCATQNHISGTLRSRCHRRHRPGLDGSGPSPGSERGRLRRDGLRFFRLHSSVQYGCRRPPVRREDHGLRSDDDSRASRSHCQFHRKPCWR